MSGIPESWAGGWLSVDLDAIIDNWRSLAVLAPGAECAAVVKADAYGLGVDRVAPALFGAGCRCFFVAHLGEGVALRAILGPEPTILVLNGIPPGTAAAFADATLMPVLNSPAQIAEWRALAAARGHVLPAAVQVDTGMSRFGLAPGEVSALAPDAFRGIAVRLVMSHLGCADTPADPANAAQLHGFHALRARLPAAPASLAASSGIRLGPAFHLDMIRPGASLYGVPPLQGAPNPMRAVVRLSGRIAQLRTVLPGSWVGYGARFTAARSSRIATVAVGYADGFLRAGGGAGQACLATTGQLAPIIGRISMDSLAVDVTDLPADAIGEGAPLELIGPHWPLEAAAEAAGTIGYEMLTALGRRYARRYDAPNASQR